MDSPVSNALLIEFTCKCGKNHSKTKRALNISGPFCKGCTQRNTAIKKIKNKIALNNEMLEKQIKQQ
jgi:hypothetical protein